MLLSRPTTQTDHSNLQDLLQFDELFSRRLLEPLYEQWDGLVAFLPKLMGALIVLILGLIIGFILSWVAGSILRRMGIDKLSRRAGVDAMMHEGGLKSTPSRLIAKVVFWLVVFVTLMSATALLGVRELTKLTENFVLFLPKIIVAIIIVVFGFVIANFLRHSVRSSRNSIGLTSTKTLSGLIYGMAVAITLVVALGQLGMDTKLLYNVLITIIASLGFAIALAVGLGGRDIAHNLLAGFYARESFSAGQDIAFGEYLGVIKEIRAQNTLLETPEGQIISIPNSLLFKQTVTIH